MLAIVTQHKLRSQVKSSTECLENVSCEGGGVSIYMKACNIASRPCKSVLRQCHSYNLLIGLVLNPLSESVSFVVKFACRKQISCKGAGLDWFLNTFAASLFCAEFKQTGIDSTTVCNIP